MIRLFLFLILFVNAGLFAQDDSSKKIQSQIDAAVELIDVDPEKAKTNLQMALRIGRQNDLSQYYGQIYLHLGIIHIKNNSLDSAKINLENAIDHLEPNDPIMGEAYQVLGQIMLIRDDFLQAENAFNQALESFKVVNNKKRQIEILNRLGQVSDLQHQFSKSIDYFEEGYSISESLADSVQMGEQLHNLGKAYTKLGNPSRALNVMQQAIVIKKNIHDEKELGSLYHEVGSVLLVIEEYVQAIDYFRLSLATDGDHNITIRNYENFDLIAQAYLRNEKVNRAKEVSDTLLQLANDSGELIPLIGAYKTRSAIFEKQGDFQRALQATRLYLRYEDSLHQISKDERIASLTALLDNERRDRLDEKSRLENRVIDLEGFRSGLVKYSSITFTGLVGILILIFYFKVKSDQRVNKKLKDSEKELNALRGFKDRVFTVISHDLKNPLSAFHNLSKSLEDNLETFSKEDVKEYLKNLSRSSVELKRMLTNVMEWAVSQTGHMPYRPEYINCKQLADDLRDQFLPMATDKKQNIIVFIQDSQKAFADKGMILMVLSNLLANAINFTPEKGIITIFGGTRDDLVTMGVKDTGIGISQEDQKKLFTVNESVQSIGTSNQKGTGIGLLLCKELVELNRGVMYVESVVGQGSSFYFSLPDSPL
ncbi:MAG: tetratricopeptide repeat protein [Flammeovirgaceae bacterium]|nr:tetratricopeptide repeat protein [Flammeovirgaceae bacterium]